MAFPQDLAVFKDQRFAQRPFLGVKLFFGLRPVPHKLDAAGVEGVSGTEVLGEFELPAESDSFGRLDVELSLSVMLRVEVFLLATISHNSKQMRPRAILLAGQGFQRPNMFHSFPSHPLLNAASQILGADFLEQSKDPAFFNDSSNIQTSVVLFHALQFHQFQFRQNDTLLGHSLGQIAALYLAKAISFTHALNLANFRGKLVQQQFRSIPVGMFVTRSLLDPLSLPGHIYLACDNSPSERVYAGTISALKDWSKSGIRGTLINMRGVFHCPLLEKAVPTYRQFLKNQIEINEPKLQVLSTVDCRVSRKEEIIEKLCRQLVEPVRFRECAQQVKDMELVQLGNQVLTKLVRNS